MVTVWPGLMAPFQLTWETPTEQVPLGTEQEPMTPVSWVGRRAMNSEPGLSFWGPSPLLVSLTSTLRVLPGPMQASVLVARMAMSEERTRAAGGPATVTVAVAELLPLAGSVMELETTAVFDRVPP